MRDSARSMRTTILALAVAAGLMEISTTVSAADKRPTTVYFDNDDARNLWPGQRRGGLAFVPSAVDAAHPVPALVFLHGVNPTGAVHSWFGGGQWDLRDEFEDLALRSGAGFVVIAPSQTRRATACKTLWQSFDLRGLVDAAAAALEGQARIDEDRVYVVGHSGAGCNLEGGLLSVVLPQSTLVPRGVLDIDSCLDASVASLLAHRSAETRLWVTWQELSWKRSPDEFRRIVERDQPAEAWFRMETVETDPRDPHNGTVVPSLRRMIEGWLTSAQDASASELSTSAANGSAPPDTEGGESPPDSPLPEIGNE